MVVVIVVVVAVVVYSVCCGYGAYDGGILKVVKMVVRLVVAITMTRQQICAGPEAAVLVVCGQWVLLFLLIFLLLLLFILAIFAAAVTAIGGVL